MKKKISQLNQENIKFNTHKPRPEIRDDLNSNKGGPQQRRGDDRTHNSKEQRKQGKTGN